MDLEKFFQIAFFGDSFTRQKPHFSQNKKAGISPGPHAHRDGLGSGLVIHVELHRVRVGFEAIEFFLFEGRVKDYDIASVEPFYTWRFTAAELRSMARKTMVGQQHGITLNWSGHVPRPGALSISTVPPDRSDVRSRRWRGLRSAKLNRPAFRGGCLV